MTQESQLRNKQVEEVIFKTISSHEYYSWDELLLKTKAALSDLQLSLGDIRYAVRALIEYGVPLIFRDGKIGMASTLEELIEANVTRTRLAVDKEASLPEA